MPVTQTIEVSEKPLPGFIGDRAPMGMLIGGEWTQAASGETFETVNPATGSVLATVASGGPADVDRAVAAARRAFEEPSWASMNPHDRTLVLLRIADAMEANAEELAALESMDGGIPITVTRGMVADAAKTVRYYAGWPTKILGTVNPVDPSVHCYTVREPLGVCAGIIPWNGPLVMAIWKIVPALACGNTVILKPAEQTPLTALRLGELLTEAGLPDGVVNVITGFGPGAGSSIAEHPAIDKVAFTGSTEVGKIILKASAGNLKKVSLELGGKAPNIIFPDADLDQAVPTAMMGVYFNSGQVCCAGTRIFVQRDKYDEVVDKLANFSKGVTAGDPFDAGSTIGPLVSREQYDRVKGYLSVGIEEGAKVSAGGSTIDRKGYFVQPTLFSDVKNEMRVAREEIFGPVGAAISFKDENDAVFQGNNTEYGLSAGVWTRDVARAHKFARALKAGTVWVNCYNQLDPISPFGGYKQSGFGRELGRYAIDLYTQIKSVWMKL